ncbi:MAG: hypothetical protein RLZZ369_1074, partial [Pseudomonadota bacterium]
TTRPFLVLTCDLYDHCDVALTAH